MEAAEIKNLFAELNRELSKKKVQGEILLCGGAVMCLVYKTRASTKDVDGIFAPTREMRQAAAAVAKRQGIPEDWLNDAAKGYFLGDPPRIPVLELSHLRVLAPAPEYMLAMKCVSARADGHDKEDVAFLVRHLKLKDADAVFRVIETYYPRKQIPPQTRFLVEELLER